VELENAGTPLLTAVLVKKIKRKLRLKNKRKWTKKMARSLPREEAL
jgi:hypothetical protein